ncbi:MAG: hypothetical protein JWM98_2392 [Thermoleophilia bacterium]|nr:hypothetical protein [Thermoleophilia bacterium]
MHEVSINGTAVPTTVIPMAGEDLTFVTIEYGMRTFRFSVRGRTEPLEVAYRHDFATWDPETGEQRYAWFAMDARDASRGVLIQQYVFPQLLQIHCAEHGLDPAAAELAQAV